MIGGILDLRELEVSDVMVHRTNMFTINADEPSEQIIKAVLESGYTRVPVWREDQDNIVGILHARDILAAVSKRRGDASLPQPLLDAGTVRNARGHHLPRPFGIRPGQEAHLFTVDLGTTCFGAGGEAVAISEDKG